MLSVAEHKVEKQQPWNRQVDTRGNAQDNTQGNTQSKAREMHKQCNSVKHRSSYCKWQDAICYNCQQQGNIVPACKTMVPYKVKKGKPHVLEIKVQEDPASSYSMNNTLTITTDLGPPPWKVTV